MVVLVTFGEIEMFIQINTFSLGGECAHTEYITQTKVGDAKFGAIFASPHLTLKRLRAKWKTKSSVI